MLLEKIKQGLEKCLLVVDVIIKWACIILLVSMTLTIALQVTLRWFNIPVSWSVELSQVLFVEVSFLGSYLAARRGKQIVVDMFQNAFPRILGDFCYRISALITSVYFAVIVYFCIQLWPKLMQSKTPIMNLTTGYIYIGIIIGCILMVVVGISDALTGKPNKKGGN